MKRLILAALALWLACPVSAQQRASGGRLDLYLETLDPQAWQLFFMASVVHGRLAGSTLTVTPVVTKAADGSFAASRGEQDLADFTRLAVVGRRYPAKLVDYINGYLLSPTSDGWRDAAVFAGINPDELGKFAAAEGKSALEAAYAKSSAAGAVSTALYLDGKPYDGSQRLMPLYDAVNAALPAGKRLPLPAGYKPAPKLPPPAFWVVLPQGGRKNDMLVKVFDRYFEGIKPQVLEFASKEREQLFPGLQFAPSYIIASSPAVKAKLDAEIKAGVFAEKNGYLVYEDKLRGGYYASLPEKKNTVELYVMSQCPYGVMAENSLLDAEKNALLPAGAKLEIHFIGDAKKDEKGEWQFSSLHGQAEWEENARQIYIAKYFPDKFHDYLRERNKEVTSPDWQKAAKAAGVDAAKVEKGFAEGKEMLAADFAASTALGVNSSPTFMVDGRTMLLGLGELSKVPGYEKLPPPGQPSAGCSK